MKAIFSFSEESVDDATFDAEVNGRKVKKNVGSYLRESN
jgi:hypothetical protein